MTKTEKRLTIGLVISLGLNLLIIGFIAARATDHHWRPGPDFSVGTIAEQLSPESRDALRESMRAHRDDIRAGFRGMRDARRQVRDLLTAEDFNRDAVDQAFADVRAQHDRIQIAMQQAFIDAASQMPREDREHLARMGERMMRGMMGGKRRFGPPGDGRPGDDVPGPGPQRPDMFGPGSDGPPPGD